jgi:hypothetical protein
LALDVDDQGNPRSKGTRAMEDRATTAKRSVLGYLSDQETIIFCLMSHSCLI